MSACLFIYVLVLVLLPDLSSSGTYIIPVPVEFGARKWGSNGTGHPAPFPHQSACKCDSNSQCYIWDAPD